jgi:hypothetical protein
MISARFQPQTTVDAPLKAAAAKNSALQAENGLLKKALLFYACECWHKEKCDANTGFCGKLASTMLTGLAPQGTAAVAIVPRRPSLEARFSAWHAIFLAGGLDPDSATQKAVEQTMNVQQQTVDQVFFDRLCQPEKLTAKQTRLLLAAVVGRNML